jgi:hypothetical protein
VLAVRPLSAVIPDIPNAEAFLLKNFPLAFTVTTLSVDAPDENLPYSESILWWSKYFSCPKDEMLIKIIADKNIFLINLTFFDK